MEAEFPAAYLRVKIADSRRLEIGSVGGSTGKSTYTTSLCTGLARICHCILPLSGPCPHLHCVLSTVLYTLFFPPALPAISHGKHGGADDPVCLVQLAVLDRQADASQMLPGLELQFLGERI